ncbi:hypothetical protein J27TS8_29200 [Robertmurraya siralis]|uniref:DUF3813 domain-containing protein n=1 Tax=Robertmurraya siralis TaxID=77777 RepID=A0A919WJM6_9BACI|nr:DUF3813 domain-containing protein [Robertmurraya siralis]PAE20626.1 hypothetical protein CHH80_10090 [Bacillus sp. 7504-2]GIN62927.1 hypothetical protein J27TS8_29200 [Robertmurraya siralis]
MANRLFIEARNAVDMAKNATGSGQHTAVERARNAISSAFANSTIAEQRLLTQLQNELDHLT